MLGVALFLVAFAITGWRVSRVEGTAFLLGYAAYLVVVLG
jgi:cation:H+ antiporter